MKSFGCTLFFVMPLFLFAQTNKASLTDKRFKLRLDSTVQKIAHVYLNDTNTNGISIGIYLDGRKVSYNYGTTKRNKDVLPTANNFYNLGSVAKTFVATVLAEAVVEGTVKLKDDIRMYLPKGYSNLEYNGHPVRLVDLANHTSALPQQFHTFLSVDSIAKLGSGAMIHYFNEYNQDSLLADLYHIKPDTIPGTRFQYNGNGMMLLMLLLERIYHQPYETIVTHYLATKLKMFDTKSLLDDADYNRLAQGYNNKNQPQQYLNYSGFTGGPSMNSTVNDMLKYLAANIIERDKAIKLTHKVTWRAGDGFSLGLGWMINQTENGMPFFYHDGHTGVGFNTRCVFYLKQKIGIVIIVNDVTDQEKVTEMEQQITAFINQN